MTLLDKYTYRQVTGDNDSLDADVDTALTNAQQELEEALRRPLESMSRTETVRIHSDGRAYPLATPIQSVSDPSSAVIRDYAVLGLVPQQNPLFDLIYEPFRWQDNGLSPGGGGADSTMPLATLTYTGGFTSSTLPRKLRQAICDLARVNLTQFSPTAAGVISASVGDASVRYSSPPDRAGTVQAILNEVRGYARREIGY